MTDIRRKLKKLIKHIRHSLNCAMAGRTVGGRGKRFTPRAKVILAGGSALVLAFVVLAATAAAKKCSGGAEKAGVRMAAAPASGEGVVEIVVTPSPTPPPTPTPTPKPILHRGVESEDVHPLQARLIELGYMEGDDGTTSLFGPATERGVELFQRQVNFTQELGVTLEEDGWAGDETLDLLYGDTAPKYCVKEGMKGEDISLMQQQLVDMGYMRKTTGYYGDETLAAVKDFQSRNNLGVDGMTGVKTYEMLYSPEARESASKAKRARTKANIDEMIAAAKSKLGCKYVLGNTGPNSFDCSGLVYYCLREAGSSRRRLNAAGYSRVEDWDKISSMRSLKKGDLIFFYNNAQSKVGHVGIVISGSTMIDASSRNGKVVRRSYTSSYWKDHFVCGRRPW